MEANWKGELIWNALIAREILEELCIRTLLHAANAVNI